MLDIGFDVIDYRENLREWIKKVLWLLNKFRKIIKSKMKIRKINSFFYVREKGMVRKLYGENNSK